MTKFLQGSFSVGETPGLDEADQQHRWEQTFGKRADPGVPTESKPAPSARNAYLDALENLDVYRQALEQILRVTQRAIAYSRAGVRDDEAFADIKAFAENALAAVKDGAP